MPGPAPWAPAGLDADLPPAGPDAWSSHRDLSRGEVLVPRRGPGKTYYWIRRGCLKASVISEAGQERILALLGPRSIIGEFFVGKEAPGAIRLHALIDCQVTLADAEALDRWLEGRPACRERLRQAATRDLLAAYEEIAAACFLPVSARVCRAMVCLADHIGQPVPGGTAAWRQFAARQGDIAALAGVSRETVVRVLGDLRRAGVLLAAGRGHLTVDVGRLGKEARASAPCAA